MASSVKDRSPEPSGFESLAGFVEDQCNRRLRAYVEQPRDANEHCTTEIEVLSGGYHRVPRLFQALALARADGRYARTLRQIARVDLLILDDWGPEALTAEQRRDLLEIVEDRYDARSIIVTSQVPIDVRVRAAPCCVDLTVA